MVTTVRAPWSTGQLNRKRGFHNTLTPLQSVWYHFAPQAFKLQLFWLRGRSREEHSYGGIMVNPSSDFVKHTTDLCSLPAPHSAEHCVTCNSTDSANSENTGANLAVQWKMNVWIHRPHTWLQGPVNHSVRFSQGPLLQTRESVGRSLPQPSRGRLLIWLLRQKTPRVRTPIPHSVEHCRANSHFDKITRFLLISLGC